MDCLIISLVRYYLALLINYLLFIFFSESEVTSSSSSVKQEPITNGVSDADEVIGIAEVNGDMPTTNEPSVSIYILNSYSIALKFSKEEKELSHP